MNTPRSVALIVSLLAVGAHAAEQQGPLRRRLDYGWSLSSAGAGGAEVRRVIQDGPAGRAGLKVGDRVTSVGEVAVRSEANLSTLRFAGPSGRPIRVIGHRGEERFEVSVTPNEAPLEAHPGLKLSLGEVRVPSGARLRTLTTLPPGSDRRPGVLIVGWLSCDSTEVAQPNPAGTERLIQDVIRRSGAVVVRVDKPGVGDSEGLCGEADFTTELNGYRAAFTALRDHPRVDAEKIFILGISNGGGFAPLVPGDAKVAGYVSIGGWSKTWFEHMVDLERRRLPLVGTPPERVGSAAAALSEFHAAYLFDQLTPEEVALRRPHLRGVWYDAPRSQYGRPAAFYHQLQRLDLAAAWARVGAPTLVIWGEYDWIMDRDDQEQIIRLVNANASGKARLRIVPRMDHSFTLHRSLKDAFEKMGEGRYPTEVASEVIAHLKSAR